MSRIWNSMFVVGNEFKTSANNSYEIVDRIGKGAFGTVFRVKRKLPNNNDHSSTGHSIE